MLKIENLCDSEDRYGTIRYRNFFYPEQQSPLPVTLSGVGEHDIRNPEYSWDGQFRNKDGTSALLQYTLDGCGALEWQGETIAVPCGRAMLLTLPEAHRYFLPPDSDFWKVIYVNFQGEAAAKVIRDLRDRFGCVVSLPRDGETLRLLRSFLNYPSPPSAWQGSAAGYHFLMTLGEELERTHDSFPRPEYLTRVLNYCRDHLQESISVEDLAELSGMSRWYFSREFKRAIGATVPEYLTELRLQLAMQLLQNTHDSVKEIAARCGFREPAYFIRLFARKFGKTPGAIRKS